MNPKVAIYFNYEYAVRISGFTIIEAKKEKMKLLRKKLEVITSYKADPRLTRNMYRRDELAELLAPYNEEIMSVNNKLSMLNSFEKNKHNASSKLRFCIRKDRK